MKLLLADDHTLFRDTLVEYLKRMDQDVAVEVSADFDQAFEILSKNSEFDLILLDLKMPGMNGLQGLRRVRNEYPQNKVALMSGVAEAHDVEEAIDLGAIGYFPKTLSGKALVEAIKQVVSGESFVPKEASTGQYMASYHADEDAQKTQSYSGMHSSSQTPLDHLDEATLARNASEIGLTSCETEVLSYVAQGYANKEIANELELQVVTIKLHVRGICQKLNVKNRTQAAVKAKDLGLVQ